MGRHLLHGAALAGAAVGAAALAGSAGLHPAAAPLLAAPAYLLLRVAGRRLTDLLGRRALLRRSGLEGPDRARFAAALDLLDRGHPDVARATLSGLSGPVPAGAVVYQVWARSCLRLVTHRGFGDGPAGAWAGVTAGHARPLPHLERALLAPGTPLDGGALAAEAAAADPRSLAAILGVRGLLLGTLLPAVGNPFDPFFPRAEQDLERLVGRRVLVLPRRRLRARARGLQPIRPLPPREEAALLLLSHGREDAAAAVLASADAAGTLSRRGRALRTAARILVFLRRGGEVAVTPELFARCTREIFFLHTRDFAPTEGAPHADALPDGPRRLLALLREKRSLVEALAVQWARRPAMGRILGVLARRLAEGPGRARSPVRARRFLRWWRRRGRLADDACVRNLRGLLALRGGRPAEAAAEFSRALELDPRLAAAAFNLAVARDGGAPGDGDPAAELRAAAVLDPKEGRASLLLAEYLERADRAGDAEEVYRTMLDADPMDADANLALGRLLLDEGRPGEAEEAIRRALAARDGDPEALVSLALAHMDAGRPADAAPLLRTAVDAAEGERREEARWLLHCAYREAEDHERAMEALDALPDRFLRRREEPLEEAALYLEERGRFDRSQRLLARLRELRARRGEL
jgi:tetratricopeptide (TPR) repeat protein